ncbi:MULTISPECIES: magnesium transporter CorA family protein [unclassified Rhizobium]|uniref:magnesium transporter CorA family protein n=1 Tax=unclassified Rhizobium TaxID=2613769 RepID=UPI001FFE100B|nr:MULTISPECIES: magnesium transporter CorA family protein [unclassified Rhizobium]
MLTIHRDTTPSVRQADTGVDLPDKVIWMDLMDPTAEEIAFVEAGAHIKVPSRDALSEIEASSRLSRQGDHLYLSTPVIGHATLDDAELSPAGFVLGKDILVTIRYASLPTFDAVVERMNKDGTIASSVGVFTSLLEAIVDRGADALEHLGAAIDEVSRSIFRGKISGLKDPSKATATLHRTLSRIGGLGDRLSKARDVLLGVGRIASFSGDVGHEWLAPEFRDRLAAVCKDVVSLSDYETHLSDKIQFLLDAVLGYINIEQNEIFKVLTIASVVGVPPTLLAGIWGMNFKSMPELSWTWGYPISLALIALSAILPLVWFRRKGWF